MRKIAVFTGTRADYGLLFWLLRDIESDASLQLQLMVSGSHLSPEFGLTFKQIISDGFQVDEKIEVLLSSDSIVGAAKSIGVAVLGYADALARMAPDMIIVVGDRYEALAVAQTAMIMRIPILHLHGGELSEGAYDDSIRHAITKMSYLHGTSTEVYRQRVIQLGESPDRVVNVGAIGLDHLQRTTYLTREELALSLDLALTKPYFIVTYHPVTLGDEDPVDTFSALLEALEKFQSHQIILTYPNADNGGRKITSLIRNYAISMPNRVLAIPSLGNRNYLSAVKHCDAVIGNSSSGIIEAPSFDVPTVNVGVRQKGRISAKSVLDCDTTVISLENAINEAVARSYKIQGEVIVNPYYNGGASPRILEMVKRMPISPMKNFHNLKS